MTNAITSPNTIKSFNTTTTESEVLQSFKNVTTARTESMAEETPIKATVTPQRSMAPVLPVYGNITESVSTKSAATTPTYGNDTTEGEELLESTEKQITEEQSSISKLHSSHNTHSFSSTLPYMSPTVESETKTTTPPGKQEQVTERLNEPMASTTGTPSAITEHLSNYSTLSNGSLVQNTKANEKPRETTNYDAIRITNNISQYMSTKQINMTVSLKGNIFILFKILFKQILNH